MNPHAALQTFVDGHHQGMGMYMDLHWAWWLVWLGIGVALIWALARTVAGSSEDESLSEPDPESPDEILRTRYARGEISEEELRERSRALRRSR